MPYRALTHGRVKNPVLDKNNNQFTPETKHQESVINSQAGVSNNGPPTIQKNKLNISSGSNGKSRSIYARTLMRDLLIPKNTFGNENDFAPKQGKGFPTANPTVSVGSTNTFARRAIQRRAETKTFVKGLTSKDVKNCNC